MDKPPSDDTEFENHVIREIEESDHSFSLGLMDGGWFAFDKSQAPGFTPKAGQVANLYGKGMGYPVRGLVIDGHVIYYRTADEQQAKQYDDVQKMKREKREYFETTGRAEQDAYYDALPKVFQRRIDKFRATKDDFRWDCEPYELFCCREAVKIIEVASALGAATGMVVDKYGDAPSDRPFNPAELALNFVLAFSKATSAEQKQLVPTFSSEHSGNTLGFSVRLAADYFRGPDLVIREHGALTKLVGCEEYGCPHPVPERFLAP